MGPMRRMGRMGGFDFSWCKDKAFLFAKIVGCDAGCVQIAPELVI